MYLEIEKNPHQSQSRKPLSIETSSIKSLKHLLNNDDQYSDEEDASSAECLKDLYDSNNRDKVKSSFDEPKITYVVSIKTILSTVSSTKKKKLRKPRLLGVI